jgi:hypothetical protein
MNEFSADWLALREPYDLRARNPAVLDAVVTWCKGMFAIRVVDLGCGTALRFAHWHRAFQDCRIGGFSTMTSACWRVRRRWSISAVLLREHSTGRLI